MNKPKETIGRVLAGLRDAESQAGLERRILEGLEHRATQRWSWSPLVNWIAAGGLALVVLAIALTASMHRPTRAPASGENTTNAAAVQNAVKPLAQRFDAQSTHHMKPRRHERGMRVEARPAVQTASFPAPPLPLTEQEKLLLQVARRGEPAQVARLDPDALAQHELDAEAAFAARAKQEGEQQAPETDEKGETQ